MSNNKSQSIFINRNKTPWNQHIIAILQIPYFLDS